MDRTLKHNVTKSRIAGKSVNLQIDPIACCSDLLMK